MMLVGVTVGLMLAALVGATVFLVGGKQGKTLGGPDQIASKQGGAQDILAHPELLLDPKFSYKDVNLGGIKIGDSGEAIPTDDSKKTGSGVFRLKNGAVYQTVDGKVSLMKLEDPAALAKLGLGKDKKANQQEIVRRFGQPDRTSSSVVTPDDIWEYFYDERHLVVSALGDGVTLVAEPSIRGQLREFVPACEQFVTQVKELQTRLDGGINFIEFRQKLGSVTDAFARLPAAPSGSKQAAEFRSAASDLLDKYRESAKVWASVIERSPVYKERDVKNHLNDAGQTAQMMLVKFELLRASQTN